jgi:hypothetical protein
MPSEVKSLATAAAFSMLPSEIHRDIYTAIFKGPPDSPHDLILIVLRCDLVLYFEDLDIFYEVKIFKIHICNQLNMAHALPTCSQTLKLVKKLCIKHLIKHMNSASVGLLHGCDLLTAMPPVQEVEYHHCDTATTPFWNLKRIVQAFLLLKLNMEIQIIKPQIKSIVHTKESLEVEPA